MGIEQEIGVGPYIQTSFGLSAANGYSYSGSIGSYGMQGSARPGGGTLLVAGAVGVYFLSGVPIFAF